MPPRLLSFVITDLHRGGAPLFLADLLPPLARELDAVIEVVSIAPKGEVATLLRAGGIRAVSLEARSNRDLRVVPRFAEYVRMRRPRLVFSLLIHANLLVALARPLVDHKFVWMQSIHTVQEKPRWHWWAQGLISGMADAFVAPSRAIISKLNGHGAAPRAAVIHNGIDVARFQNALPVDMPPWPRGSTVIGCIARFDPVKRLDLLIRAMNFLPAHIHLALVGYGPMEASLRALAEPLAGRVHFPGPTREPERWHKSFNLFCLPSPAEGFPLSVVEATCAGCRVVACDTAAMREAAPGAVLAGEELGPRELSGVLLRALEGPGGAPFGAELERYARDRMVARYASLIREGLQMGQNP
jgi:glycosyltransferase involved in cell wall biosynthesis